MRVVGWDGAPVRTLEGLSTAVGYLAWSADGRTIAARASDGVGMWDVATGAATFVRNDTATASTISRMSISADGRLVASTWNQEHAWVWTAPPARTGAA